MAISLRASRRGYAEGADGETQRLRRAQEARPDLPRRDRDLLDAEQSGLGERRAREPPPLVAQRPTDAHRRVEVFSALQLTAVAPGAPYAAGGRRRCAWRPRRSPRAPSPPLSYQRSSRARRIRPRARTVERLPNLQVAPPGSRAPGRSAPVVRSRRSSRSKTTCPSRERRASASMAFAPARAACRKAGIVFSTAGPAAPRWPPIRIAFAATILIALTIVRGRGALAG